MKTYNVLHATKEIKEVFETINEWLKSDDVFITDKDGKVLEDAEISCVPSSLIKRLAVTIEPKKVDNDIWDDSIKEFAKTSEFKNAKLNSNIDGMYISYLKNNYNLIPKTK